MLDKKGGSFLVCVHCTDTMSRQEKKLGDLTKSETTDQRVCICFYNHLIARGGSLNGRVWLSSMGNAGSCFKERRRSHHSQGFALPGTSRRFRDFLFRLYLYPPLCTRHLLSRPKSRFSATNNNARQPRGLSLSSSSFSIQQQHLPPILTGNTKTNNRALETEKETESQKP